MAGQITVTVDPKAKTLTIVAPLPKKAAPSKSGKSLIVASTGGNVETDAEFNGQKIVLGLNAYVPNNDAE